MPTKIVEKKAQVGVKVYTEFGINTNMIVREANNGRRLGFGMGVPFLCRDVTGRKLKEMVAWTMG